MRTVSILVAATLTLLAGCGTAPQAATTGVQVAAAEDQLEAYKRAYPVEDVLGIGPAYAAKLAKAGITKTDQLLAAARTRTDRHHLADATGIPYGNVLHLARKVELMRINGIGVRQSNLLEAVGVDSVKELAQRVPDNLYDRMMIANNISRPFVKVNPSKSAVTRWVTDAKAILSAGQAITE